MACIPPNPRRVGYIVPIHGPLDGPLYMGSIYSNSQLLSKKLNQCKQLLVEVQVQKEGTTFTPVKMKYHRLKFELLSTNRGKRVQNLHVLPFRSQQALHGH